MIDKENIFGDADAIFEEGAAPTVTDHAIAETRTDFLPWHKPRKQWIRAKQWAQVIGSLADQLKLKESSEPLRYLSLPGPDLLDVRSIHPVCAQRDIQLQFVGLNGGADDSNVALSRALESQVRDLPGIHPSSEVVKDRFEHLGVTKSVAHSKVMTSQRTFDVVNIDLCGSFAESLPVADHATIPAALLSLIHHQASNRNRDWLLFVTSRSDSGAVKPEVMQKFIDWLNTEINSAPEIRTALIDGNLLLETDFVDGKIQSEHLSPQSHSNAFATGFSYWIVHALAAAKPAWKVDMLEHIEYHVTLKDRACDMISLGFWCKQLAEQRPSDKFGIVKDSNEKVIPIENVLATCVKKVHRRISERSDVDVLLNVNTDRYQNALDDSAKLLGSAMYDEKAYRIWAEDERAKMEKFLISVGLA
jgi:hypothetical protein